jgi:hypothetical protein
VYYVQDLIAAAINNYWRLSALDSLSMVDKLPIAEYVKTINILLGNQQIGMVLVNHLEQLTNNKSLICLGAIPITSNI